jgi:DNA-directed RNA polymerase specialized sigma24 family protein
MRNIHLDSIKKRHEEPLNPDAPEPMVTDDPHAQIEFSEVHKFIMTLSEEIRDVLILAAEGMTSSEMSEILKIPAGTARRRLFDGRMKLSERFNGSVLA